MKTTILPTAVAARLVAGHVDLLWGQWANDHEAPGCCPECCAPCNALKELLDLGKLDDLYGVYVEQVGGAELATWDPKKRQVRRDWLQQAWGLGCDLHPHREDADAQAREHQAHD